jgi:hypothetical protein
MAYDSRPATHEHIHQVQKLLTRVLVDLQERLVLHDRSKLSDPEKAAFDEVSSALRKTTYGSDEYKANLAKIRPALDHHFAHNAHHPEFGEMSADGPVEWRSVREYQDHYEVSNYGDVRSLTRTVKRSGKQGDVTMQGRDLAAHPTPKGYRRIRLQRDGDGANFFVHRLVAEAFLGKREGMEVNHRNGDKADNRVRNLEWKTSSGNQLHAYDTGLKEPAIKYVVHCPELDLTTLGTEAMERALRERGYDRAKASGVWAAMDREGKHLDLTFEGTLLAEARRDRISHMTLVDLLEMVCDWIAAGMRHDDGVDFDRSAAINQERFGYSDELASILRNTARTLGY